VEEDGGLEVLEAAESVGGLLDRLDLGVESFSHGATAHNAAYVASSAAIRKTRRARRAGLNFRFQPWPDARRAQD
jgi:hypothetical protein